jgi:hypothetical protein
MGSGNTKLEQQIKMQHGDLHTVAGQCPTTFVEDWKIFEKWAKIKRFWLLAYIYIFPIIVPKPF